MTKASHVFLTLLALIMLAVITSCEKEAATAVKPPVSSDPGLSLSNVDNQSNMTVDADQLVRFTINVTAPSGLKTLIINRTLADGPTTEDTRVTYNPDVKPNSDSHDVVFRTLPEEYGKDIRLDITATDIKDVQTTITFVIHVR